MRYCTNCHRITAGDPLFCNVCGQSYNIKFCPRLHPNPRAAQVCSQCGSRELSTPQPKPGLGTLPLLLLVRILPGIALFLATIALIFALVQAAISAQELIVPLLIRAGILLAVVWIVYLMLPGFLRHAIRGIAHRAKRSAQHGSDRKGAGSSHR